MPAWPAPERRDETAQGEQAQYSGEDSSAEPMPADQDEEHPEAAEQGDGRDDSAPPEASAGEGWNGHGRKATPSRPWAKASQAEAARQQVSRETIRLVSNPVVGLGGTVGDAEPPPDQEGSNTHQHDPDGRPQPEESNRNPPLWAERPR